MRKQFHSVYYSSGLSDENNACLNYLRYFFIYFGIDIGLHSYIQNTDRQAFLFFFNVIDVLCFRNIELSCTQLLWWSESLCSHLTNQDTSCVITPLCHLSLRNTNRKWRQWARHVRFGTEFNQIGTIWDKSGTFLRSVFCSLWFRFLFISTQ